MKYPRAKLLEIERKYRILITNRYDSMTEIAENPVFYDYEKAHKYVVEENSQSKVKYYSIIEECYLK